MNPLFCDCCGDSVTVVYPCKFVFPDNTESPINICLDCMNSDKPLTFSPYRKKLVSKILKSLKMRKQKC